MHPSIHPCIRPIFILDRELNFIPDQSSRLGGIPIYLASLSPTMDSGSLSIDSHNSSEVRLGLNEELRRE
jgi:hypothetical protein